jgi:hypothetical protein
MSENPSSASVNSNLPHLRSAMKHGSSSRFQSPERTPDSEIVATSPQSPPHFTAKVSFDTFENPDATMFSFTLRVKSEGYKRTRSTRVFLCAASSDESGSEALDWALESLVQDGDELIVYRGIEQDDLGAWISVLLNHTYALRL